MQNAFQVHALHITWSSIFYPPKLCGPAILDRVQEQQYFRRDKEVTIGCTSPIFAYHQHIAEVSYQSYSNKGEKKVMWDSFKATSRNSLASTYGFQIRN
jgi:hypothetical protein